MAEHTPAGRLVQAMLLRDVPKVQEAQRHMQSGDHETFEMTVSIVLSLLLVRYFGVRTTPQLVERFVDEVAQTFPQDKALPREQAVALVLYFLTGTEPSEELDPDRSSVSEVQMMATAALALGLEKDEAEVESIVSQAEDFIEAAEAAEG